MREIVVISGKGRTGKTSLVASFAALAASVASVVLADCDVDAADLHLVLAPEVLETEEFRAGRTAVIRQEDCIGCSACLARCRFDAVRRTEGEGGKQTFNIDPIACEGCGVCVRACPVEAADFPEKVSGEWYVSKTRCGPMVHARLGAAEENSGKLVTAVRNEAKRIAEEEELELVLIDGAPGIGCPVIASLAGASQVLLVTEPTFSGEHDMRRVLDLAGHFGLLAALCVNKADLNPEMAGRMEGAAGAREAKVLARVRYDPAVTAAQVAGRAVVEHDDGPASLDIETVWEELCRAMP